MVNLEFKYSLSDPSVYTASLTTIDDDIYEGEEYFTLSVVDPPGIMENYTKTVIIQDNEGMWYYMYLLNCLEAKKLMYQ